MECKCCNTAAEINKQKIEAIEELNYYARQIMSDLSNVDRDTLRNIRECISFIEEFEKSPDNEVANEAKAIAEEAKAAADEAKIAADEAKEFHITPQMFGAKGDGVTDDTEAIKQAIKFVYTYTGTWTGCKKLYFPKGKYLVTDTLIDAELNVPAGQFVFEGESEYGVSIRAQTNVLFDNVGVFGFTLFKNISFTGTNTFMNAVGGGTGNAQSLVFENCCFNSFHTVLNVSGNTMMSEITFNTCKIRASGSDDNPCELFIMNNDQAVNWRFFGTDIESFTGTLISLYAGASMYFYQGSIIPINGNVIKIPSTANRALFGQNNSPSCTFYGVRFELRKSTLIDTNKSCKPVIIFRECGMGGSNLEGVTPITGNAGSVDARFINCFNLTGYKYNIQNINSTATSEVLNTFSFENCDVNIVSFLNDSSYSLTNIYNTVYVPRIINNGREYRKTAGRSSNAVAQDVMLSSCTYSSGRELTAKSTYNIYGILLSIQVVCTGTNNYGNTIMSFTFKNGEETIGTAELPTKGGIVEVPVGKRLTELTVESSHNFGNNSVIAPYYFIAKII